MKTRLLSGLYTFVAFYLFMRCPGPDSMILALAGLLAIAIWTEELWEWIKGPPVDHGPLCPKCGYDVRASPVRCPECGTPRETAAVDENRPAADRGAAKLS
jgi:hypothetical protein